MNAAQKRMLSRRWGVFNHYLYNMPWSVPEGIDRTDWNARVDRYDVKRVAKDLHDIGAGYYCITVMQGCEYMIAPNQTFDAIAGTKSGEACSRRDLIGDLIEALEKYDIDLYLYYTGDGPYQNLEIGKRFGFIEPRENISLDFCKKWASVLEEYAVRYGNGVKGWWIDGCYDFFGYDQERLACLYTAIKKGNPNALTAMNNGVKQDLYKWYEKDEITSGELPEFTVIPKARSIDGALPHLLVPFGKSQKGFGIWARPGLHYNIDFMREYVHRVNEAGGVVTLDTHIRYDSAFDPEQLEALRTLRD